MCNYISVRLQFFEKKKEELKNSNLQIDEKSSSKFRIGQIE